MKKDYEWLDKRKIGGSENAKLQLKCTEKEATNK
jgi:hypothetical protein